MEWKSLTHWAAARSIWIPVLALAASLLASALIFLLSAVDPLEAYREIFTVALGSYMGLRECILKAAPLILCGLAVAIPAKVGLWNIGGEGQLLLGVVASTWVAVFTDIPAALKLPAMLLAGFTAGALWALLPAILKAKLNVNDILTTLMMNYIAANFYEYLLLGPFRDPIHIGFPTSPLFPDYTLIPVIPGTGIHSGFLLALAAVALSYFTLKHTVWGFEFRLTGSGVSVARYGGVNVAKVSLAAMCVAGGLAGLAGFGEVAGVHGVMRRGISPGYGYTGILVAWLAHLHPVAIVFSSLLLGVLYVGGYSLQIKLRLPSSSAFMLQGSLFMALIAFEALAENRSLRRWLARASDLLAGLMGRFR